MILKPSDRFKKFFIFDVQEIAGLTIADRMEMMTDDSIAEIQQNCFVTFCVFSFLVIIASPQHDIKESQR